MNLDLLVCLGEDVWLARIKLPLDALDDPVADVSTHGAFECFDLYADYDKLALDERTAWGRIAV